MNRLILLVIINQAFCLPLAINFQMVVKDNYGRPLNFQDESITFHMKGTVGIFWTETKSFTTPNGIVNTKLGSTVPIDPVSFYAQDSVRLIVTKANGDTLLSEPFNAVPYSFKADFSDSARSAYSLQGKGPNDFLPMTYQTTIKQLISDSIYSHTALDLAQRISDSISSARMSIRQEIKDTSLVLRTSLGDHLKDSISAARGSFQAEISDSLNANYKVYSHPNCATPTTFQIGFTNGIVKVYYISYGQFIACHISGNNIREMYSTSSTHFMLHISNYDITGTEPETKIHISYKLNGEIEIWNNFDYGGMQTIVIEAHKSY